MIIIKDALITAKIANTSKLVSDAKDTIGSNITPAIIKLTTTIVEKTGVCYLPLTSANLGLIHFCLLIP